MEEVSSTEYKFTSTSTGIGISLTWEFGDGYGYDGPQNPINHTYSEAGFYTVTLTATSETGFESVASYTLAAGLPKVINGDFEDSDGTGKDDWRPSLGFTGGEGNGDPYSGSGDGAYQLYDGTDTESSTRGAKIDGSRCTVDADGNPVSGDTRYAYQSMTLDPNTEYYLEFSYDNASGTIVAGEILDGHFADGSAALAASLDGSSLLEIKGTVSNGEDIGNDWRTIRAKFTTNATGEVAIWMWAFGGQSYYDNVKILPAWLVESGG
ncbi:PKD domain-containing protein [Fulvivirga ulvae]|nr:PKD domain-containing protein [Fulvivirga ulvae]